MSVLSGLDGPSWLSVPSCISGLRGLRCFLCLRCLLSFLCLRCLLDVRVAFRIFGGPSGPSWSSFALCAFGASIGDFGALVVFGAFGAFCAFCAFVCFRCLQGLWLHSGPSGAFWFFGCTRGLRSNCFWITPWPLQDEKNKVRLINCHFWLWGDRLLWQCDFGARAPLAPQAHTHPMWHGVNLWVYPWVVSRVCKRGRPRGCLGWA